MGRARRRRALPAPLLVRRLDQPRRPQHERLHGHVELASRQRPDPKRGGEPGSGRALRERGRPGRGRGAAAGGLQGPLGCRDRRAAPGVVPDRRPRARAAGLPGSLPRRARGVAYDARPGARRRRRSRLDRRGRGDPRPASDHRRSRGSDRNRRPGGRPDPRRRRPDRRSALRRARHGTERVPAPEDARVGAPLAHARRLRPRRVARARSPTRSPRDRRGLDRRRTRRASPPRG